MGDVPTMVERVARAMIASRNLPDGCEINWPVVESDARAAIAAMREHTFGPMSLCVNDVPQVTISGSGPTEIWRCLFDAALASPEPIDGTPGAD